MRKLCAGRVCVNTILCTLCNILSSLTLRLFFNRLAVCVIDEGCAPVVLICRSGKRSVEAGNQLIADGMTNVYNVTQGFEGDLDDNHHRSTQGGWRYENLPWEQC